MKENIELAKDRGVADVITASLLYIKQHFKPLMKAQFFIAGPFLLIFSVFYSVFIVTSTNKFAAFGQDPDTFMSNLGGFFIQLFLVLLLLAISFFFYLGVLLEYMKLQEETKTIPTVSQVWKEVRRDFWKLVVTGISLVLIAFMGMSVILMVAMFFVVALMVIHPVLGIAGYVAFIGLCLFLMAPLGLVYPSCIIERRSFFDALSKAFTVISGNWWKTSGLIFLSMVIQLSLTFIFQIPEIGRAILTQHLQYEMGDYEWLFIGLSVINLLIGYIIGMIMQVTLAFQYFSLREKKDAHSLMDKIALIGTGFQPGLSQDEETY